ncbi:MAG TPA: cation-transporting P-type ATPase [Polyangiaceae bacterium]|nr:cation-transporting P-type ATPase [Polyangiaceae bacterium]
MRREAAQFFGSLKKLFSERSRRTWIGRTRAHIEFRELSALELATFKRQAELGFKALSRVEWVELNPHTRRVVVSFEQDAYGIAELTEVVAEAERSAGLERAPFRDEIWEHPSDSETVERLKVGLLADTVGVVVGLGLRFSPIPVSRLAGTAAALVAIVQSTDRLRGAVEERLGPLRADLTLDVTAALAHGFAQRPGSALVEATHKLSRLAEAEARRRVWQQREAELCQAQAVHRLEDATRHGRPRALPRGPIEEYADRAWIVSLGGFGVSFLTTRSVQRAVAALFGGLPRPARLGRDAFAADLGRALAKRQTLVLDPEVLRKLDRVDCLVLQADLVARDRFEIRKLVVSTEVDESEVRPLIQQLLDVQRPIDIKRKGEHTLAPLGVLDVAVPPELAQHTPALGARGGLVFGLMRESALIAAAEVDLVPQTGIDELIAAAHEAQMRVVIASNNEAILQGIAADDTIPEGDGFERGIRRLQREGRTVCVVVTGATPGIAAADCAIGLTREGELTPWGAHIICRDDLSDVRFLIHSCVVARQVSKQSVNIALGAASLGALVSAGGGVQLTARRVIAVVNAASLISMLNGVRGSLKLARRALPAPRDRTPWHALEAEGVLKKLGTSREGLIRRDALRRRRRAPEQRSALAELAENVTDELFNPLAPLLAAGAGLSAAVGSFGDASMVGGVVVLNALIGGVQRFRTERRIRELTRTARRRALVRRGSDSSEVDATDLVRGDVIVLEAGDVVPADCRIIDAESLEVDASSLTGESLPVRKTAAASFERHVADRSSMLFEGTALAAGRALAVVVATGDETEARRGAVASKRDPSRGGVERRMKSLVNLTGPVALAAGVGVIGAGLVRGRKLEDLVGTGVSLAVASVPEGLPLLATAAQLAAADRLSKQGALVRNARSIEALGRVDVLCIDKTGTLTEGRVELSFVSDGEETTPIAELSEIGKGVLAAALRAASDLRAGPSTQDPMDAALARAGNARKVESGSRGFIRGAEQAFEAGRAYQAVSYRSPELVLVAVKGSPEAVLPHAEFWQRGAERVPLDRALRAELLAKAREFGRHGLRVLSVAEREDNRSEPLDLSRLHGLTFRGFIAFSDPVRPTSAQAVADLRAAGVELVMLTGDHPSTAEAVARDVDLLHGRAVITGTELTELSDEELDRKIKGCGVFARVTPAQKVRVVRALQRAGRVVAMVGDGANDAPAIRLSNVGIAIGEGSTSAARAAADIVLTDERIETLVLAMVEGRAMWASVRDAVSILVGGNLGEIGFTLGAGLVDGRPPLNARQLLLVNLLTDVAPAMAIALRPPSSATMESLAQEGPEASLGKALNRDIAARAVVTSMGAGTAWLLGRFTGTRANANTVGLLALVGSQLGQTLVSGRFSRPVLVTSVTSAALLAGIVQTPGLSHLFGCRPLGPLGWATAIGASTAATYAASRFPTLINEVMYRIKLDKPVLVEDPESLPE